MTLSRRNFLAFSGIFATSMALAVPAFAQQLPANVAEAIQRIEAARQGFTTLDAQFVQTRTMGLFAQELRASGRLMIRRPDAIRWELQGENPGVFIVRGRRVSYRAGASSGTADQNQVGPLGTVLADLTTFLGGSIAGLAARYDLAVENSAGGGLVLTARPKEASLRQQIEFIKLQFAAGLQVIQTIDIAEPDNSGQTHVELRSPRLNARLPGNAFTP